MGIQIAKSISEPLADLRGAMLAITSGNYDRRVAGLTAGDEIGEMARAVEVFRENAIAKRRAEEDLRHAKESAETALSDLRETQTSLIEAEKLAALGGLVAGVAHEVNNPVGISLTVASSLARRCDEFADEVASGQLRRSRLEEFTKSAATAANQLVANLMRAGELVQSFKQVAVDRSQAERRTFDLGQGVEQILASLRPTLKTSAVTLSVEVPAGIKMDSYPGPLGQILTNLFLNALHHGFEGRDGGSISVSARRRGRDDVEILFRDDGHGMSEEVQRCAFDPFFTTRRGSGGTGLGLHIVYNLVTARLGGRVILSSSPGLGATFLIVLPLVAPGEAARSETMRAEAGNV
jgi:signal transduction histidine kinase